MVSFRIHCIVDVSPSGIQRLHSLRIYPIVIRVKFKSAKQIKDVKEDFCGEKITTKQAKDLIDKVSRLICPLALAYADEIACSLLRYLIYLCDTVRGPVTLSILIGPTCASC